MKRINYGDVNYLVGDEVADTMVRFTARLTTAQQGDAVEVNVLGPDGNAEVATFALGPGVAVTAESTRSVLAEPDNAAAVAFMKDAVARLDAAPEPITPEDFRSTAEALE